MQDAARNSGCDCHYSLRTVAPNSELQTQRQAAVHNLGPPMRPQNLHVCAAKSGLNATKSGLDATKSGLNAYILGLDAEVSGLDADATGLDAKI